MLSSVDQHSVVAQLAASSRRSKSRWACARILAAIQSSWIFPLPVELDVCCFGLFLNIIAISGLIGWVLLLSGSARSRDGNPSIFTPSGIFPLTQSMGSDRTIQVSKSSRKRDRGPPSLHVLLYLVVSAPNLFQPRPKGRTPPERTGFLTDKFWVTFTWPSMMDWHAGLGVFFPGNLYSASSFGRVYVKPAHPLSALGC